MKIKYNKIFLFLASGTSFLVGSYFLIGYPEQDQSGYFTLAVFAGIAGLLCDS